MIAEEMGSSDNRGRIIWVLASSRPDLIEVDLKRPGRVDLKIPLFPTSTARESFDLIRALSKPRGIEFDAARFGEIDSLMPLLLTPGAAEALSVKIYRESRTQNLDPFESLRVSLKDTATPCRPTSCRRRFNSAVGEATDSPSSLPTS